MHDLETVRPVWAEINLDHLTHNIREIRKIVRPETIITGVVKADGYGHGAIEIAETLLENGVDRLAVGTLSEAIELRRRYHTVPILILGYTPESSAKEVIVNSIIQTVYSLEQAQKFSQKAQVLKKNLKIHIKIDTGMNRIGLPANHHTVEIIKKIYKLPNLIIEGIFTHFATADEKDKTFTYQQYEKYIDVVHMLEREGIYIPIKHVSNSAAIVDLPEMNLDMVRPGILLYGLYPSDEVKKDVISLKPVMSLKAKVTHVKEVDQGIGISYGLKYVTNRRSKIASLPIGYADGFTRILSGKAKVLIKGHKVPIVGRICMDQCMIDVTDIDDVQPGDLVILVGSDGIHTISFDDIAKNIGTISYEMICMIGKRIPRVYMKHNEIVTIRDYILG
jgi:alanine racemase